MSENTKLIPLSQGLHAIVDADDYEMLSTFKWRAMRNRNVVYACRAVKKTDGTRALILMHRQIMRPLHNYVVDHINHIGLDNRQENLRVCTHSENMQNRRSCVGKSSPYLGVHWSPHHSKWGAQITVSGRTIKLGKFQNDVVAAMAYDVAARRFHGEFANPNFTPEQASCLVIEPEPPSN